MTRRRHHPRPHGPPWRISRRVRIATAWLGLTLWLSGCVWLLLHYFFQQPGDFGPMPHPWEPVLLRVHGIVAVAGVFLFGWLSARHVVEAWWQRHQRSSGITLLSVIIALTLTGYALYYLSNEGLRHGVAIAHEFIGALTLIFAVLHWHRPRANRIAEAKSIHRDYPH